MMHLHRRMTVVAGALSAAVTLGLAACSSSTSSGSAPGVHTVNVSLTDAGCEPAALQVAAGPTTFVVTNLGADAVTEFEVVRNGTIVGEVENVAAGLERSFSLNLDAGTYETRCPGGTDAATGTLTATGSSAPAGSTSATVDAAVAAYRTFIENRTDQLVARTRVFTQAVLDGDQERARSTFAWAREPYEAIEPVAEAFGDLDPQIDARENDVPPDAWTGFHRLEKALWVDRSLAGIAPIATKLGADVAKLHGLVRTVELDPAQIANGATELLGEVSKSKITGEEDRYSHTDLWDFQANVDGSRAAFVALRPLLALRDPALATLIGLRFAVVDRALDPYRDGGGFVLYVDLSTQDTRVLSSTIDALAEPLSRVAGTVVGA
jgi:iron uptake system component EfeO